MATVTPTGKAPADRAPASEAPARKAPIGRAVIWIGLALGTAATVFAVMNGIRIPGLEVVLSVAVTWVLLIVVAVTVAELLRRHHRAMARHAWRHGKRGVLFARRHTHRGASSLGGYLTRKAAVRWQARQQASRPAPKTPAGTADPGPTPTPAGAATGTGTPPPERKTTMADTIINDDTTGAGRRPGSRIRPARRARHAAARGGGAMPG